jgi:hypothetical protein
LALLDDAARQGALAEGAVILADKGVAGRVFHQHLRELGAWLVRPDRKDRAAPVRVAWRHAPVDRERGRHLKDQLGLERHGARTLGGVFVGVGQRLLALAAGIWFNWQLGAEDKRSLVAYDH